MLLKSFLFFGGKNVVEQKRCWDGGRLGCNHVASGTLSEFQVAVSCPDGGGVKPIVAGFMVVATMCRMPKSTATVFIDY